MVDPTAHGNKSTHASVLYVVHTIEMTLYQAHTYGNYMMEL
jgi:hypothetical protein